MTGESYRGPTNDEVALVTRMRKVAQKHLASSWVPEIRELSTDQIAVVIAELHRDDQATADFPALREAAAAVIQDRVIQQQAATVLTMERLEKKATQLELLAIFLTVVLGLLGLFF